jgi:hypothetical protein
MKRLTLILLVCITALQLKAQQATFKQVYAPNTTYSFTNVTKMHMNMTPQAATTPDVKEMVMDMTVNTTVSSATGARAKNNDVPVKMSTKMGDMAFTMNGNAVPMGNMPKNDMKMYGRYTAAGKLELDSVGGMKLSDSVKTAMKAIMVNAQNNITFPDHPLKVGESFTQENPFSMPIPGVMDANNKMSVKTTYKLLSITNNIGVFDLLQVMNIDLNQAAKGQAMQINLKATGAGKMNFDIKKQFLSSMTDNIDMTMNMNMGPTVINAKAALNIDVNVAVMPN